MSNLRELGTVAFDLDVMRRTIEMRGSTLSVGAWLAIVPEGRYRNMAENVARSVAATWHMRAVGHREVEQIVLQIQAACVRELRTYDNGRTLPVMKIGGIPDHPHWLPSSRDLPAP